MVSVRKPPVGNTRHYTLRFAVEHRDSFKNIRTGKKRVETRAATTKYRDIKAGDEVTFKCGAQKFSRIVSNAAHFRTITALFKKYKVQDIRPDAKTQKEMVEIWNSFPNYKEKITKFGLMALEFKK